MSAAPPPFSIREHRPGDASAMAEVFYAAVRTLGPRRYTPGQAVAWAPEPPDPAAVRARAGDGRATLVALGASGAVMAYGDLEPGGCIDHLYRHPDAPDGVAAELLDALLARAVLAGLDKVRTEASELARGLFHRKGFVLIARRDFELRGVAIHNYAMERRL
jgi:putative acetyltransferase